MISWKDMLTSWRSELGEEVKRALQVNLTLNWHFLPVSDGGTAWITQESFDRDETDSGVGLKWKNVARQLKEDLSGIILLSEEELEVSVPRSHSPGLCCPLRPSFHASCHHNFIIPSFLSSSQMTAKILFFCCCCCCCCCC